jgi:hypothetical protein
MRDLHDYKGTLQIPQECSVDEKEVVGLVIENY